MYLSLAEEHRRRICLVVSTLTAPSLSPKGDTHTEDRVYCLSERYLCAVSEWISLVACGGDIWPWTCGLHVETPIGISFRLLRLANTARP